ncbi:ABC transporter permease subunit [Amnibacterium sp. CER49]|uniref:ABC transporter permease subunit n=1 Tax=Amnibacterium sp. CER49 TaxID=3039161 RepID=UPI00244AE212|nr:ABC transporter permease subunit [Amnibacterium sp. CER49]MDH2445463.1 ABC transporter permease subunit [Amnibacterium sp. CER49]
MRRRGPWLRFAVLLVVTVVLLLPVLSIVWRALLPLGDDGGDVPGGPLGVLALTLANPTTLLLLRNSLGTTAVTVLVTVLVAAPAGYVLSRGRGRRVAVFSLLVFGVQSLPLVVFLVPLFVVFAQIGLVDDLVGVTILYIGAAVSVGIWMMGAAFDAIPAELEEAAWLDGCGVLGGFVRVVLRNALPGVLSTAVYTFLFAWNDYWIASLFLGTNTNYTLGLGVAGGGGGPALAVVALIPPLLVFAVFHRYFSLGGVSGSLAGT